MSHPNRNNYDRTQIEWTKLRQFAERVARETNAPRGVHTRNSRITKTREVRGGFFGLSKRIETYTVPQAESVTDDHWVIESRYWSRNEKGAGSEADEISFNRIDYCLGVDGSLFVRVESREEVYPKNSACFETRHEPTVRPMNERDVLLFDFEPKRVHTEGRISVETNRDPDESRLKYSSKGIGLSVALKRLLEKTS